MSNNLPNGLTIEKLKRARELLISDGKPEYYWIPIGPVKKCCHGFTYVDKRIHSVKVLNATS